MNLKIKRKYYSSPQIEAISIDQSISLVMMSPPSVPGDDDPFGAPAPTSIDGGDSPFGGGRPDYDM